MSAKASYILRLFLALITVIFVVRWISTQEIPDIPRNSGSLIWLGLALVSLIPALGFRALKWKLEIEPVFQSITFKESLKSYVGAMPLSMITPGRIGELARLLYLPPAPRGKIQGVFLVGIDKVMDLGGLLLWCSFSALLIFDLKISLLVLLLSLFVNAFPLWMKHAGKFSKFCLRSLNVKTEKLDFIEENSYSFTRVAAISFCSLSSFGMQWLQTWFLLNAWGAQNVSLDTVCQVMALVTLLNIFQITFAGLGIREGLAGYGLMKFASISPMIGASSAFCLFIIDQIIPSLIGINLKTRKETSNKNKEKKDL